MVRGAAVKGRPNKIMRLLAEKYPTKEAVYEQLIYLQSRLSLPKGIEHFMSDLHGEYASFFHILNNCSGVIREKVTMSSVSGSARRRKRSSAPSSIIPRKKSSR